MIFIRRCWNGIFYDLLNNPKLDFFNKFFIHNFRSYHVKGPRDRLIIKYPEKSGFNDAFFNTRSGKIVIGRNVYFGHSVYLITGRKDFDTITNEHFDTVTTGEDIVIDDNCYIGSRVTIIGGVTIGANSIIGAGCTVYKDVPPNSFVKSNNMVICKRR